MFHSISWLQFFSFLFGGLLVYYGYFGLVYYRAGRLRFGREKAVAAGADAVEASAPEMERQAVTSVDKAPGSVENALGRENASTQEGNNTRASDEKATVTHALENPMLQTSIDTIKQLRQVFERAVGNGMSWEEIRKRLHDVLNHCQELRGTEYEASINNFIERRCRDAFGQKLGKEEWVQLWGEKEEKQTH